MSDHEGDKDAQSVATSTQDNPQASSKDKLKEDAKMLKIVEAFEAAYAKQKENYNKLDTITMNNQITVKSLIHCLKFNKKNLEPENPDWDSLGFEDQLNTMDKEVTATNTAYAACKKQEMTLSEQIINKDTSAFKLVKVEKIKKQQDDFYSKIDDIDDGIYKQQKQSQTLWDQYENYNEKLFRDKLDSTTQLITETTDLSKQVNESLDQLSEAMDQVLKESKIVEPFTEDQKKFYAKISIQIEKCNQTLKDSKTEMVKEAKKEETLLEEHEECKQIVEKISKMNEANDLIHLAEVTERLSELCSNYNDYSATHQRQQTLLQDQIKPAQENVKTQMVELSKFIKEVKATMKAAFIDYMKKIDTMCKKNSLETESQYLRLKDFEERNIDDPINSQNIPHSDVLYLKKEVARYNVSIAMVLSIKDSIQEHCEKLEKERQDKENQGDDLILMSIIDILKGNLTTLTTQSTMEIPRIKKNIDQLEAFLVKHLKTKLNDDNKASQAQIAAMTKRFDDYTKYIGTLNDNVTSVRKNITALEEQFADEDLEKDNQFRDDLTNATNNCDNDINGDKNSRSQDAPKEVDDGGLSESKLNLLARKKLIITNTNKLVNNFNENNKLIKESNITPKTDVQIHEIITKNNNLQKFCSEIDQKISDGNVKGKEIEIRLSTIDKTKIPELEKKYTTKNETIDECDKIFDENETKCNKLEETLKEKTALVDQVLAQILAVSPLTNPALPAKGNETFIKQVADLVGRGHDIRDELENIHKRLLHQQDKLMDDIQPLNELGERVVTQEEIVEIMDKMKILGQSFAELENNLKPFINQLEALMKDVDTCISNEKSKNSGIADQHLKNLDDKVAKLQALKTDALKKLAEYRKGIQELKQNEGKHCGILLDTLALLNEESNGIEESIHELDGQINALNDKRNEHKATADDAGANPHTFTPKQIDELNVKLDEDLHKQADILLEKDQDINDDLDRRIEQLKHLKANNGAIDNLNAQAKDLSKQLGDQLTQTQDMIKTLPQKITDMMKSLTEMKNDTEPDKKSADYFEKKKTIDQWIKMMTSQQKKSEEVQAQLPGLDKNINEIKIKLKSNENIDAHSTTINDFNNLTTLMNLVHQNTLSIKEAIDTLRNEMGNCQIPENIKKRASELNAMQDLLNKIHDQFKAYKAEHRGDLKDNEYDQEIKSIIETMIKKLDEQEFKKRDLNRFQCNTLEKYTETDFLKNDNDQIIVQVREHKENIRSTLEEIQEVEQHYLFVMESKDKFNILNDLKVKCEDNLDEIHQILETSPDQIVKMLATLEEMRKGTEHQPNDHECTHDPDYFDQKDKIKMNINTLLKVKASLDGIDDKFNDQEDAVDALIVKSRAADDNSGLDLVVDDFKKQLATISKMQKIATDSKATVNRIKEELGDCDIPIHIGKRVNNLEEFDQALNEIKEQFEFLKEEDSDLDDEFINPDTEAKIRSLVVSIDKQIHGFELEQIEFEKTQKSPIETYSADEHKSHDNAPIIAQVREHKHQIQDAIDRLKDLEAVVKDAHLRKETYTEINDHADTCNANFCALIEMNAQLPKEIKDSLFLCQTMLDGAVPDATADYFELRQDIEEWIFAFKQSTDAIGKIKVKFLKQQVEVSTLIEVAKKETDIKGLLSVKEGFEKQVEAVNAILSEADAQNETVMGIKQQMGYCQIPENTTKRANEIEDFKGRLQGIQIDFFDFKIDFAKSSSLSSESKVEIKKHIDQIDSKLFSFDEERKSFSDYQKQKLELNTTKEYMNTTKAPVIIVEIREFQAKILDANERLKELELLIKDCKQKKGHHQLINDVSKDMEVDIGNLKEFLKNTPNDIHHMLATHEEMRMGSLDKNADYFTQKEQIQFNTNSLKDVEHKIAEINEEFEAKQKDYGKIKANFLKAASSQKLPDIEAQHHNQKKEFATILSKANKCRETVDYIKTTMDECEIPYTISLRADEVDKFVLKLDRITKDFQELKQQDYEDCHCDTKASIRKLTEQMLQKLSGFEDDKVDFIQFQKGTLDEYTSKNFLDVKNAPIIAEVREHKLKIYDSNWRLGELEDFLRQAKAQKLSLLKIDVSNKALGSNIQNLGQLISQIPQEVDQLLKTLTQMQLASVPLKGYPNDIADYAKQAQQISEYQVELQNITAELQEINDSHEEKNNDHQDLKHQTKHQTDVTALVNIQDEFTKHHQIVDSLQKRSVNIQERVRAIKVKMDDVSIPLNIKLRQQQIQEFQDKLMAVNDSFTLLQKCLHNDTDPKVMKELNDKLQGFREEQKAFVTLQRVYLSSLTKDDFLNLTKQVGIIPQIKAHKDKITIAMQRLKEFGELINKTIGQQHSHGNITQAINDINANIAKLRELLGQLPDQIDKMLKTNQEMKYGSQPDDTADYWEEKDKIDQNITNLVNAKNKLHDINSTINQKENELKTAIAKSKKTGDNETLTKIETGILNERQEVEEILNSAYDINDEVQDIKTKMGDCEIPVNIAMRENEIERFVVKLERIEEDFKDLKQADEDFEGTSSSEADIKKLIREFEPKLAGFQIEKRDFNKYQQNKLNRYTKKDFESLDNAPIITEIREFKAQIDDANKRLKDLDAMTNQLNNMLILQDIENASKLLGVKNQKLRERLEIAQTDLKKIDQCGTEMDGNCSRNEEEEFIEALKDEMPDVFNNIHSNFEQIDKIQSLIVQIQTTKSIDLLQTLKSEVDDATTKVEQCEGLVTKLENEIIEWDSQKKLCRRDEELEEIDNLLRDFQNDLTAETDQMYPKLDQNSKKLEASTSASDVEDFQKLVEGIKEYIQDVEKLGLEVNYLLEEKDECFEEFDNEIPTNIKDEREIRRKAKNLVMTPTASRRQDMKSNRSNQESKPNDKYYMLHVNCKYRKRIHEMLKNLRELNKKRRELEDKWGPFKRELNKVKEVKVYKAIKGDAIDELFAFHLNKHQLNLPIKRIGPGKYLFGSKQILAKIINGKLVIRVGGGYMSADEFIEQYGPMEILKMQQAEDRTLDLEDDQGATRETMSKRQGSNHRMSIRVSGGSPGGKNQPSMSEMKAAMRESMSNIKVYGNDPQLNTRQSLQGSPKGQGSPKRGSLAQKSPQHGK